MNHQKHTFLITTLLVIMSALLAACNIEGLAAFSPTNDRIAIITNNNQLYVTNRDGHDVRTVSSDAILTGFDVSFDPTGSFILYADANLGICIVEILSGRQGCPLALPEEAANAGILSDLPSGDILLVSRISDSWTLAVYQPDSTLIASQTGIDQLFMPGTLFTSKRTSNGKEWHLRPYGGGQTVRWVTIIEGVASLWSASSTVTGPVAFSSSLSVAITALLDERDQTDITSGVLAPDGTRLAFRIDTGNQHYDVYTVNLNSGDWRRLVAGADFRAEFVFSPDGQMIAYENNIDGRSVWLADSDGDNARRLAANASLPAWNSEIPQ